MREDRDLIARFVSGDQSGFETLYARYRQPVYVYLLSFVRNRSIAEELLQEAFCTFLRHVAKIPESGSVKSFLFRTARSRAIDYLRREKREDRALRERSEDPMFRPSLDPFPVNGDEPDGERLGRLLHRLPDEQREAIVLKIFAGMTFVEIGRLSGVPENTVVSRYRYGIRKMREALVPRG